MFQNEQISWHFISSILLIYLIHCNAFTWKCPDNSQWFFRSDNKCKDQAYLCLFDTKNSIYKEICGKGEEIGREGFTYILTPNPDQVPCATSRYQPFTYTTDGNSQCVFSKSLCKSSGQVLANNGTSSIDTSCRCDYRRNYDYVIPPKDPCSCKPAEEDCSCYIRKCEDDEVMIADYRCMKNVETILPEDIKCPIINRNIPSEEADTVYKIQFQPVSGSVTWSKQAAVILVVIVIIYTVLIGFLFFSVPNVTSILLKSEVQLSIKRKENEFMILNGDKVKIECNFKSYIPVRSVTWQKEIDDEIIQITPYNDKYEMVLGKKPSLTINNFDAEDQGKYRCIIRNTVGLMNVIFGSCMHYLSSVNWLTRIVKVLQHIPAFNTEDMMYMILHTYVIDSQSKPTVYNVYKGDEVTMEQHFIGQQKLLAVKWFKESDIWTELDMSSEQYSGGVPDVPSLTIKSTTIGNAGKYFCLLMYDNGETQNSLFKLKIIPQVKIYKDLLDHRLDKTFIRPSICDTIYQHMQENNIVVVTGREGTGKSIISLELASIYDKKDYMIWKVDLSENIMYTDIANALLIIDNQHYTQDSLNVFMKHLLPVLSEKNIKVILTFRNVDLQVERRIPEINKLKEEVFIAIDKCLTAAEKEEMLRSYMKVNNVTSSSSVEGNFRNPKIINDLSVQVILDEIAIKVIRNEEPWIGFPLSAALFCSERKFLHLGEKYFTNPPRYLVEELKQLYEAARKTSNCKDTINEYCVLVYIMNKKNHQLDLNDPNLCSQLDELYHTFFNFKNKPERPGSNEDQKIAIKEAVHRMNNKYLKFHEGVYDFIHPCLVKAMFLSSESMVPYLLTNGSLHDITEFVRSECYTALEDELVIKIGEEYHHTLCERLSRHAFESHSLLQHVAQYIYSYWRSTDNNLVNEMFRHIEFILFRSLARHTGDILTHDAESLTENSINLEDSVQFSKIIMFLDQLTYKGRDQRIYGPDTSDFLILSALVSAAMNRYATHRVQTFDILLKEFQNRIHLESFVKLWSKPLDLYGNNFFHYLMLLSQEEASEIISVTAERKFIFDTENVKKYTPLDIAAFLGKKIVLEELNLRTNYTQKLRDRLKRLAISGNEEYYYEKQKNKNIDQPMVHKTKDDSATPDKRKSEDADEEKKGIKDRFSFLKRTSNIRKEKPSKKEKHDINDVLCFEDCVIHIVVMGKKQDYLSIIELLS